MNITPPPAGRFQFIGGMRCDTTSSLPAAVNIGNTTQAGTGSSGMGTGSTLVDAMHIYAVRHLQCHPHHHRYGKLHKHKTNSVVG
ncbi:MAG: hypothetical protein IPH84_19730 [Bacteroidales bacterium]|nr:hypothetical protein [Bacteroidales bacterium]